MANRVSVEIDARVEGFQQGMNAATDSARKYETETQKIADATGNFRKELSKAKKDVQNLALGYARLSKEAKASAFGREMKRQLDEAKQAAADYIDMQGDLQQELRNLASDTHTLDMLSEGMGTFMNTTSAALGVVAQFTGNEKDAQRAIVAFTTAESTLSAITKIQNALQMQSNTMMAVTKIQTLAAAAAERIRTAATGKGIVATKAATVAQAAFNAVASANPYVLLATAIIGVATAIGVYVLATKDAETETDRENKRIAEARQRWNEYKQKVAESAADMIAQYKALEAEWNALRTTEEKNKFLDDNKNKFHNMGLEIDDVNELEELFVRNSAAVVKALKARAEAEAWGEIYKEQLKKKLTADLNGSVENNRYYRKAKAGDHISDDEKKRLNINTTVAYHGQTATTAAMSGTYERGITAAEAQRVNALRNADALKRQREEQEDLNKILDKYTQSTVAANQATAALSTTLTHSNKKTNNGGGSGGGNADKKKELTELQKLEQEVQKYEEQLKNVQNPEAPSSQALIQGIQANLKKAREEVTKYKLAVGLEVEPSTLENMEAELKQKKLMLYADISQEDKDNIYQEILQLEDDIEKEKIKAHIIIDPEIEANNKIQQEIADIMASINVQEKPKFDFNNIAEVDEGQAEMLNRLAEQYRRVYDAREELMELMNASGASDNQIAAAQAALEEINPQLDTMLDKLNMFKDIDDAVGDAIKNTKKLQKSVNQVGDALQACGDLFSALGQATDDDGMKVMGIVAQAIATVALSFAQALASCKTWVDWLAFGVTGLAAMITMIGQINSLTSGYAEGGIIGGSSYAGDRLYARVNSGEMILNSRQQRNLFDMLDTGTMPQKGGTNVQVQGVIRGTDLLLVQKNTNKVRSKSGTQIHF